MEEAVRSWRSRVRLVDELFEFLLARIYSGHYPAGARLVQEELAAELNVSRTPLREAMRMLEREGLLTVSPTGAVRVVSPDINELAAAYELREVVDGLAARLAAESGDKDLNVELRASLRRQKATLSPWNPADYTRENIAFHSAIIEGSANPYVIGQLGLLRKTADILKPRTILNRTRGEEAVREHRAIANAIASRNPDDAERLARAHIHTTIDQLRAEIEQQRQGMGVTFAEGSLGSRGR